MRLMIFDPKVPELFKIRVLVANINTILNNWAQVLWLDARGML